MQELKPVAFMSTDCIGERFLCFSRPNDNDKCEDLYALPATHRIVPVELLKTVARLAQWPEHHEVQKLQAIIDKEPTCPSA